LEYLQFQGNAAREQVSPSIDICKWNPNKKPNGECQPVGMGGGETAGGEGGEGGAGGAGAGAKGEAGKAGKGGKAAAGAGSAEKQLEDKAKKAEAADQMGGGVTKEAGPAKAES